MKLFNEDYPVIYIIGPRRSGKTTLLSYLVCNTNLMDSIDNVIVISPTVDKQTVFSDIFNKLSDKRIVKSSEVNIDYTAIPERSLIMLDDTGRIEKTNFKKMLISNRHRKIKICFLGHCLIHLVPELRANLDYIFTFKNSTKRERTLLYNDYAGSILTIDKFDSIYNGLKQHEFLIFALNQDKNIAKCVLV